MAKKLAKKQVGGKAGSYVPPNQPGGKPMAGGAKLTSTAGATKKDFKNFIKKVNTTFNIINIALF